MLFIFLTPVLIRHLWQLKTVVFLHRCLICVVLLSAPSLATNIRLGCFCPEVTNALAYYTVLLNTTAKSFMVQAQEGELGFFEEK